MTTTTLQGKQHKNLVQLVTAVSVVVVTAVALAWYHRNSSKQKEGSTTNKKKHQNNDDDNRRRAAEEAAAVEDSENGKAFLQAIKRIQSSQYGFDKLSNAEKLIFYALYKQVLEGDAPQVRFQIPSSPEQHAKRTAWSHLRGMPHEEAIGRYIAAVNNTCDRIDQGIEDTSDEDAYLGLAPRQSRPEIDNGGIQKESATQASSPESSLLFAAGSNNAALISTLVKDTKVNVNHCDASGQTALHLAADKGASDCVSTLIELVADVNASDHDGISVLQAAVIAGNVDVCRLLLKAGANPDQTDADGDSPRSCAADDGSELMQQLFAH